MENSWPDEVEHLLEKNRINSIVLSERHRSNFYEYKENINHYQNGSIYQSLLYLFYLALLALALSLI